MMLVYEKYQNKEFRDKDMGLNYDILETTYCKSFRLYGVCRVWATRSGLSGKSNELAYT